MFALSLLHLTPHLGFETVELRLWNKTVQRVLQFVYLVVQLTFEVHWILLPSCKTATRISFLSSLLSLFTLLIFMIRIRWSCSFTLPFVSQADDIELHSLEGFFKWFWIPSHLILHFSLPIFNFSKGGMVSNVFFTKILNQTLQFLKKKVQSVDLYMEAF